MALTAIGADMIRARWPTKPVVQIHHGCPDWFPPRKQKRGTVIGAFGFLEPHKGFHHLLEVLRALPGTELLIFSHAKSAEAEAAWAAECAGLPVRWEQRYLSAVEIARQLAAEADVIVFWYRDRPQVSASGAVRVQDSRHREIFYAGLVLQLSFHGECLTAASSVTARSAALGYGE